jgi:hypothetical protein
MSDDLVKRLLDWEMWDEGDINDAREEAHARIEELCVLHREYEKLLRERIEELEADLRKMALDYLAAQGQAAEAYQAQLAAEAKLAKCQALMHAGFAELKRRLVMALEALDALADCVDDGCLCSEMQMATAMDHARTVLEKLEGELDD